MSLNNFIVEAFTLHPYFTNFWTSHLTHYWWQRWDLC